VPKRARFVLSLSPVGKVLIADSSGELKEVINVSPGVVLIRHTAKTEPGNSGSPLLDQDLNEVVGLHHIGELKGSYETSCEFSEFKSLFVDSKPSGIGIGTSAACIVEYMKQHPCQKVPSVMHKDDKNARKWTSQVFN
jgi:hypothetical protein